MKNSVLLANSNVKHYWLLTNRMFNVITTILPYFLKVMFEKPTWRTSNNTKLFHLCNKYLCSDVHKWLINKRMLLKLMCKGHKVYTWRVCQFVKLSWRTWLERPLTLFVLLNEGTVWQGLFCDYLLLSDRHLSPKNLKTSNHRKTFYKGEN